LKLANEHGNVIGVVSAKLSYCQQFRSANSRNSLMRHFAPLSGLTLFM
jgi:hypothetical protein